MALALERGVGDELNGGTWGCVKAPAAMGLRWSANLMAANLMAVAVLMTKQCAEAS